MWIESDEEIEAAVGKGCGLIVHSDAAIGGEVGYGAVGGRDADEAVAQKVEALTCPVLCYPIAEATVVVGRGTEEPHPKSLSQGEGSRYILSILIISRVYTLLSI